MNTEDKFYFGKPGQPERFENAPWMSEVNRMLRDLGRERAKIKIWISGSNSVTTAASSRGDLRSGGFTFLVGGRMADYLTRAVPGATMQHTEQRDYPKKGLWTSFYKVSNLPKELIAYLKNWGIGTTPQAFSGFTGASAVAYSRPGQPERFDAVSGPRESTKERARNLANYFNSEGIDAWSEDGTVFVANDSFQKAKQLQRDYSGGFFKNVTVKNYQSRPGQPERFGLEDACWEGYEPVGTKQKDGRTVPNCVPKDKNEQPQEFAAKKQSAIQVTDAEYAALVAADAEMEQWLKYQYQPTQQQKAIRHAGKAAMASALARLNATHKKWEAASSDAERAQIENQYAASGRSYKSKHFSRPGSPDKFDASSLDRGNFAEASKSPMLGKLLAAKVMPDGGWRAVQVGSDTLVISFEDADLARDFGRRASTKGYSATSPVATTGRYWNVEVKNGK